MGKGPIPLNDDVAARLAERWNRKNQEDHKSPEDIKAMHKQGLILDVEVEFERSLGKREAGLNKGERSTS